MFFGRSPGKEKEEEVVNTQSREEIERLQDENDCLEKQVCKMELIIQLYLCIYLFIRWQILVGWLNLKKTFD